MNVTITEKHLDTVKLLEKSDSYSELTDCLLATACKDAGHDVIDCGMSTIEMGLDTYYIDKETQALIELFCNYRYDEIATSLPHIATLTLLYRYDHCKKEGV